MYLKKVNTRMFWSVTAIFGAVVLFILASVLNSGAGGMVTQANDQSSVLSAENQTLVRGDVDCNGEVESVDALWLLKFVAGLLDDLESVCDNTPEPDVAEPCVPEDLFLSDIAVKLGGYGDMRLSDIEDRDTFTMTVVEGTNSQHWASVGIDLLRFWDWGTKPGTDLSCYKYMVVHAKGAVGGEEFRIGLGIMPIDYLYDRGLTTQWQDIAFDMRQIWDLDERNNVKQAGFEIGPDWTDNAYGTTIYIDGVRFTNQSSAIVVP